MDDKGVKIGLLTEKDFHSHKIKKSALNTQVCIDFGGWTNWTSGSLPAGRWNDPKQLGLCVEEFKKVVSLLNCLNSNS